MLTDAPLNEPVARWVIPPPLAGVAHLTLYGETVVSAVKSCPVVPIGKLSKVPAPVPIMMSPEAAISVAIEFVIVTAPLVPPPEIPVPAVAPVHAEPVAAEEETVVEEVKPKKKIVRKKAEA